MGYHQRSRLLAVHLEIVGRADKAPQVVLRSNVDDFRVDVLSRCGRVAQEGEAIGIAARVAHADPFVAIVFRENIRRDNGRVRNGAAKAAYVYRRAQVVAARIHETIEFISRAAEAEAEGRRGDGLVVGPSKCGGEGLRLAVPRGRGF